MTLICGLRFSEKWLQLESCTCYDEFFGGLNGKVNDTDIELSEVLEALEYNATNGQYGGQFSLSKKNLF